MSDLAHLEDAEYGPLTRAALDRSNTQGTASFVYFIADQNAKQIKIGRAVNVKARLSSLQGGSTNELQLLGALAGGKELERELHQRFAESRIRGEWFRPTGELLHLIRAAFEAGTGRPWGTDGDPVARGEEADDGLTVARRKLEKKRVDDFASVMGISRPEAVRLLARIEASEAAA